MKTETEEKKADEEYKPRTREVLKEFGKSSALYCQGSFGYWIILNNPSVSWV